MKYIFPILFLFAIVSCTNSETETTEPELVDNFTISGEIIDAGNSDVTVEALSESGTITVSTVKTDASGKFELKGNIPGMGIYQLRLGAAQDKAIPLTLEPNIHLKVNTSFADFAVKPNMSGASWTPVMNKYMELFNDFLAKQQVLGGNASRFTQEEMALKVMELRKDLDNFAIEEMKKNPGSLFNVILFSSAAPVNGFERWNPENLDILKSVAKAFQDKYPDSPITATMQTQVMQVQSAYQQFTMASAGAKMAPEIELKNPQGKVIKLSSLRGKYVLIDFWASWCGPCRQENPNVVRLYNKYKDRGFTVYSVSLDRDAEAWKAAIKSDGLVWPNHVSDLLQWQSPMISLYGFDGIPYTVLVDKEGEIIGTGLRGASLEQKLVELLGK